MKTTRKLVLLAALNLALAATTARAQAGPDNQIPGQPPQGLPPGPPRIGVLLAALLDKYDANKDGQLDSTELATLKKDLADGTIPLPPPPGGPRGQNRPPPLPKEILDKYDANHDGVLDETERAALRKDIEAGKVQIPTGAGGPGAGVRPPTLSAKELLAKYDTDGDGKLDEIELAALLKDLHRHRPPPPGVMGGPPNGAPDPSAAPPAGGPPQ